MITVLDPTEGPPTTLKSLKDGGVKSSPDAFWSSNSISKTVFRGIFEEDTLAVNTGSCAVRVKTLNKEKHSHTAIRRILKFSFLTGSFYTGFLMLTLATPCREMRLDNRDLHRIDRHPIRAGLVIGFRDDDLTLFGGH